MAKKQSLADALAILGVSEQNLIPQQVLDEQDEIRTTKDWVDLEAESVIFYFETKGSEAIWKKRICKMCNAKFMSTYTGISTCSVKCRKDSLAAKGLTWDPTQSESERWGGTIPKFIGPEATKALQGVDFPDEPEPIKQASPVGPEEDDDWDDFLSSLD